jgi:hypothetical protein
MSKKWKFVGSGLVTVAVGTALFAQSPASADEPTYTKAVVQFCADKHRNNLIRPGDDVPCVRVLQQLLNKTPEVKALTRDSRKPFLLVDGDFGKATKRAVLTHEKALGWEQDAIVGRGTFLSLLKFAPADPTPGPSDDVREAKAR